MPRIILNVGPLHIEESRTKNNEKVYRLFVRSSGNSVARLDTLNKIRLGLERELVSKGFLKPKQAREKSKERNRIYREKNREILNQKKREYWQKNKTWLNAKRRAQKNGSSL